MAQDLGVATAGDAFPDRFGDVDAAHVQDVQDVRGGATRLALGSDLPGEW
ncbi:hypothetical protein ACFC08_20980 [Streptomyces sp. NPDC056112]